MSNQEAIASEVVATAAQPQGSVVAQETVCPAEELAELREFLLTRVGAKIEFTWRLRAKRHEIQKPFTKSRGTVHGAEGDTLYIRFDEDDAADLLSYNLYPFPNPDADYSKLQVEQGERPSGIKRMREEPSLIVVPVAATVAAIEAPSGLQDLARLLQDGKLQKSSQNVKGGEGLRIPANVAAPFESLYPPMWFARRERGEKALDLEGLWHESFKNLQAHLGATAVTPAQRDELRQQARSAVGAIHHPLTPSTRQHWEDVFAPVLSWLKIAIQTAHNTKTAETLVQRAKLSIKKGDLMDFEDLVTAIEASPGETSQSNANDFRQSSDFPSVKRVIEDIMAPKTSRGRGGWRARGRGRGRAS